MATAPKKVSNIDKALAQRLKDYWGAYLKQVRNLDIDKDIEKILDRSNSPVEHVFNNHKHCDLSWCYALKANEEKKTYSRHQIVRFMTKQRMRKFICNC